MRMDQGPQRAQVRVILQKPQQAVLQRPALSHAHQLVALGNQILQFENDILSQAVS